MKHPDRETLALHAGGDLGPLARWKTLRHLSKCERCRDEVASFEAVREMVPALAETPEISGGRLAAEMKANIRRGLAAGECVRSGELPLRETPLFAGARAAIAFAGVIALLVTGLVLERPAPGTDVARFQGVELQSTPNGIQVREGGGALRLQHAGAKTGDVDYTAGAQGSMRARYVDTETGYVTVTNVYAN